MRNKMTTGDSAHPVVRRVNQLVEGIMNRHQRVYVEAYEGEPVFRLSNGRTITRSQLKQGSVDLNDVRAYAERERHDGLVSIGGNLFAEPANAMSMQVVSNLVVDGGLNMIRDSLIEMVEQKLAGGAVTIPTAVPTGMALGRDANSSGIAGTTFTTSSANNLTATFAAAYEYATGFPQTTAIVGEIAYKVEFPGGAGNDGSNGSTNGVDDLCQVAQVPVVTEGPGTGTSLGTISANATSIINFNSNITLGAADTLDVTVLWDIGT